LLYPKEDKQNHKLMFACRTCQYSMPAPSDCVARHEVTSTVGDTAGITQDVAQDPTVGAPDTLPSFSPEQIPGFCTMCGQEIFCEVCGQETDGGLFLEVFDGPYVDADDNDADADIDLDDAYTTDPESDDAMSYRASAAVGDFDHAHFSDAAFSPDFRTPATRSPMQLPSNGPLLKEGDVPLDGHST
jgi:DNA-directed RNA polymerase II subunit RPB9